MINICMAIYNKDGKYSKYTATTITSIVANTKAKVHFYILCDFTLSEVEREKMNYIVNRNDSSISFIDIDVTNFMLDNSNLNRFTRGTLYRMKMIDLLPKDVNRILYLDSDIIVDLDIQELWDTDIKGNAIAGVLEREQEDLLDNAHYDILDEGVLDDKSYINAGVMIMDLSKISQICNLYTDGMHFIRQHPTYLFDQDAINYLFKNKIFVLEKRYNYYSVRSRNERDICGGKIYHFSGDCPRDVSDYYVDRAFCNYYKLSGWCDDNEFVRHYYKRVVEKNEEKDKLLRMLKTINNFDKNIVFWGVGGDLHPKIMSFFEIKEGTFFVDVKRYLIDNKHMNCDVKSPECLEFEDANSTIIISTINRYNEVIEMAKKWEFYDGVNLFDGRLLLTEKELSCSYGNRDCKWDI